MASKKVSLKDLKKRQTMYNIAAGSNTESVFKSKIFVDFFLNTVIRQMDHVKTLVFQISIKNDGVSPMSLIPTFSWFDFIEFYFNDDLLDTIRRDHIFVSHCFLDALNTNNYGNLEGFTSNDNSSSGGITSTITLAAGETKTYYLPIPTNILCTDGLLISALDGQIKVRAYFNLANEIVYSGTSTDLKLMDLQILSSGIKYEDTEVAKSIMNKDYKLDTIGHRWSIKGLGVLSNSQSYDISQESLKGSMEYLFFYLLKGGANQKDFYQSDTPYYYDMKQLQLIDSNGGNAGFYSNMQSNFLKSLVPSQSLNSQWLSLFSTYMLQFSTNPRKSYWGNKHKGSEYLDGKYYLRFQPNLDASLASSNMVLCSIGFQDAELIINNGKLMINFI